MTDIRRQLPSVGKLLDTNGVQNLLLHYPRSVVVDSLRAIIEDARASGLEIADNSITVALKARIDTALRPTLRPVVNATGVILHTNLGRAPLADAAMTAVSEIAHSYNNLEYDLDEGARGSRYSHCVALLKELTGAEDAIVVNNCAAALVLSLASLSFEKDAIVSRGELVEIGGSFRIPDIMKASGANLVEVGTTNRTHVDDYLRAAGPNTGAFVKVHRSNFSVTGYVAEVGIERLAPVGNERGIPVIHDLGSGLLISLETLGLSGEPLASDAVQAGATLVLMSGDKLLGGPQAGIIVGKAAAVARLKMNPLARALRVDKLTIAALSATLQLYRDPVRAIREIPILALLSVNPSDLLRRATALSSDLKRSGVDSRVISTSGSVGGGAFPGKTLESFAVAVDGNAIEVEAKLRAAEMPVIGRIQDGKFLLDLRSVMGREDSILLNSVEKALA